MRCLIWYVCVAAWISLQYTIDKTVKEKLSLQYSYIIKWRHDLITMIGWGLSSIKYAIKEFWNLIVLDPGKISFFSHIGSLFLVLFWLLIIIATLQFSSYYDFVVGDVPCYSLFMLFSPTPQFLAKTEVYRHRLSCGSGRCNMSRIRSTDCSCVHGQISQQEARTKDGGIAFPPSE